MSSSNSFLEFVKHPLTFQPHQKGWYTWSTVVLAIVALSYVIVFAFLPIITGVYSGSMGLLLMGLVGFGLWFAFSGVLYYTSNACRKNYSSFEKKLGQY